MVEAVPAVAEEVAPAVVAVDDVLPAAPAEVSVAANAELAIDIAASNAIVVFFILFPYFYKITKMRSHLHWQ
ncbi:hypothetical protein GCM10027342_14770 [Photobacterium alginatilyticum]